MQLNIENLTSEQFTNLFKAVEILQSVGIDNYAAMFTGFVLQNEKNQLVQENLDFKYFQGEEEIYALLILKNDPEEVEAIMFNIEKLTEEGKSHFMQEEALVLNDKNIPYDLIQTLEQPSMDLIHETMGIKRLTQEALIENREVARPFFTDEDFYWMLATKAERSTQKRRRRRK